MAKSFLVKEHSKPTAIPDVISLKNYPLHVQLACNPYLSITIRTVSKLDAFLSASSPSLTNTLRNT